MELSEYVGSWGHYSAYPLTDKEVVHPEDFERLKNPYGRVYLGVCQCVALEGNYLVLTSHFGPCRVKPSSYTKLKPPVFEVGQYVYLRKKLDRPRRIIARTYHNQRKEIIYKVETNCTSIDLYWFDYQLIASKDVDFD